MNTLSYYMMFLLWTINSVCIYNLFLNIKFIQYILFAKWESAPGACIYNVWLSCSSVWMNERKWKFTLYIDNSYTQQTNKERGVYSFLYRYSTQNDIRWVRIQERGKLDRSEFIGHSYLRWPAGTGSVCNQNQAQERPAVVPPRAARDTVGSVRNLDPDTPTTTQVDHVGSEGCGHSTVGILRAEWSHGGFCLELYGTGIALPCTIVLNLEIVEDC